MAPMQTRLPRAPLVILISGRGSNMRSLVESAAAGELDCDVAGVISNRADAAGLEWAAGRGIATRVVDHRGSPDRRDFDTAIAAAVTDLAGNHPTPWVALAGFMRILGDGFVDRHAGRLVNIHPSLLPLYPGLHTHRQALADGALLHGATVHLVTPKLDHGPIVGQAVVPVLAGDSEPALADRVLSMEHRLYPMALQWLVTGRVSLAAGRVLLDGSDRPHQRVLRHPLLQADAAR